MRSPFLEHPGIELPAIALVVSGGHTALYLCPEEGRLPPARADARRRRGRGVRQGGEDSWASPTPAGPVIDRISEGGERKRDRLPARRHEEPVARLLVLRLEDRGRASAPPTTAWRTVNAPDAARPRRRSAISSRRFSARSSRRSLDDDAQGLPTRGRDDGPRSRAASPATAGCVAPSSRPPPAHGLSVFMPSPRYTTDNAAMIGAAAFLHFERERFRSARRQRGPELEARSLITGPDFGSSRSSRRRVRRASRISRPRRAGAGTRSGR